MAEAWGRGTEVRYNKFVEVLAPLNIMAACLRMVSRVCPVEEGIESYIDDTKL